MVYFFEMLFEKVFEIDGKFFIYNKIQKYVYFFEMLFEKVFEIDGKFFIYNKIQINLLYIINKV